MKPDIKVLITRRWPDMVERHLSDRYAVSLRDADRPMTQDELAAAARSHDVVCCTVSDRIDAAIVSQPGAALRLLCNYGAGVDHIDLDACRRHGVVVTNTPDVLTDATAEIAILLMLMVARRAEEGARELRAGEWAGWRPTHLMGRQLTGKALGLVGFGRIARATAARARGFGMSIRYHARNRSPADDELSLQARYDPDLMDLLSQSDIVSLHVPGGAETRHMIDARGLAAMRDGAVLINTARGAVIDERALIDALLAGRIAAGLDVFEGEPAVNPALLACPNVVALPHLGSATMEARTAMGMRAAANLHAWVAGDLPPDLAGAGESIDVRI